MALVAGQIPVHVAKIFQKGSLSWLFLYREEESLYRWYLVEKLDSPIATQVEAPNCQQAIREARRFFKECAFQTLKCGFRYTLPERDEHGINALFHQMCSSLQSFNGVYFDDELGHNCFVQNSSLEAIGLMRQLLKLQAGSKSAPAEKVD